MIHAFRSGERTVVVAAADIASFELYAAALIAEPPLRSTARRASALDRMMDASLEKFDRAVLPIVVEHEDDEAADAFARSAGITLSDSHRAVDLHRKMIAPVTNERKAKEPIDNRTIAEILGIDKVDPHDHRTDEQKAADEVRKDKARKAFEEAQKRGQLSSDSFTAPTNGNVQITDIAVREVGGAKIIDALANKGLHTLNDAQERARQIEAAESDARSHVDTYDAGDGAPPQSRRATDYLFAAIDPEMPGRDPYVILSPRLHWHRERRLDDRPLSAALAAVLPSGATERDPGQFFIPDTDVETLIDLFQAAKFQPDLAFKDWFLRTYEQEGGLLDLMSAPAAPSPSPTPSISRRRASSGPQESFTGEQPEDADEAPITEYIDANGDDTFITAKGMISNYFRVEVDGADIADIKDMLLATFGPRLRKRIVAERNASYGCWIATIHEPWTVQMFNEITKASYTARMSVVDRRGVPTTYVPEKVADPVEVPIRPWNERRPEWDRLTDAEREANRKTWAADEMLICGQEDHGVCRIYVCPESWFKTHNTFFPERLDISHLLPNYVEEFQPWSFRDTSHKDWNSFSFEIENVRKFKFSMALQLVWNHRDA